MTLHWAGCNSLYSKQSTELLQTYGAKAGFALAFSFLRHCSSNKFFTLLHTNVVNRGLCLNIRSSRAIFDFFFPMCTLIPFNYVFWLTPVTLFLLLLFDFSMKPPEPYGRDSETKFIDSNKLGDSGIYNIKLRKKPFGSYNYRGTHLPFCDLLYGTFCDLLYGTSPGTN